MARVVWDNVGERVYETGIDRGVLYIPGSVVGGVPWNGITEVTEERKGATTTPYYLDGVKYLDATTEVDYAATLSALTYPKEFQAFDGLGLVRSGLYLDNQPTLGAFGLSYRTKVGSDAGENIGYRIHMLWNLTATPTDKSYTTIGKDTTPVPFSWSITGVPTVTPGYRPTCHAFLDTREVSPAFISTMEGILYGDNVPPQLPDLVAIMSAVY